MIKSQAAADIEFTLNGSDLGFYNEQLEYVTEAGKFQLFIGQSSNDNALNATFYVI